MTTGKWHQVYHRRALRLLSREALSFAQAQSYLRLEATTLLQPNWGGQHWHATGSEGPHCSGSNLINILRTIYLTHSCTESFVVQVNLGISCFLSANLWIYNCKMVLFREGIPNLQSFLVFLYAINYMQALFFSPCL